MADGNCPKYGGSKWNEGFIRAATGFWSDVYHVNSAKFRALSCQKCGYTEFYKIDSIEREKDEDDFVRFD